jgi:uncharacterized membrane protein YkoI
MQKNIVMYIIASLVIVGIIGVGIYSSLNSTEDVGNKVMVNSTGGTLSVSETPVSEQETSTKEVTSKPISNNTQNKSMNKVTIETNKGKIVLELYPKNDSSTISMIQKDKQKKYQPTQQEWLEKINDQQSKLMLALTKALESVPDDPILRAEILDAIRLAANLKTQTKNLTNKFSKTLYYIKNYTYNIHQIQLFLNINY